MNEEQKIYHELEMLQEMGLLEDDLLGVFNQELKNKQDEKAMENLEENEPRKELENHMVKGLEG